jgi:hypothetical protein
MLVGTTAKKTLLIATVLTTWPLSQSAAQNTSSVLQSLPAEVQTNIEDVRAGCRETLKGYGADTTTITSGDNGLMSSTANLVVSIHFVHYPSPAAPNKLGGWNAARHSPSVAFRQWSNALVRLQASI